MITRTEFFLCVDLGFEESATKNQVFTVPMETESNG